MGVRVKWNNNNNSSAEADCPQCGRAAQLVQFGPAYSFLGGHYAAMFVCPCGWPMLIVVTGSNLSAPVLATPAPRRHFPDADYLRFVPANVRRALDQAYAATSTESWTLVGVGCRIAIERMAKGQGAQGDNLYARLQNLKTKFPALEGAVGNAHVIRLVGNAGAHDPDFELEEVEALATLSFAEEVLRDVYIFPERQKELIAKLPKRP
jgi:hypothetical protein